MKTCLPDSSRPNGQPRSPRKTSPYLTSFLEARFWIVARSKIRDPARTVRPITAPIRQQNPPYRSTTAPGLANSAYRYE